MNRRSILERNESFPSLEDVLGDPLAEDDLDASRLKLLDQTSRELGRPVTAEEGVRRLDDGDVFLAGILTDNFCEEKGREVSAIVALFPSRFFHRGRAKKLVQLTSSVLNAEEDKQRQEQVSLRRNEEGESPETRPTHLNRNRPSPNHHDVLKVIPERSLSLKEDLLRVGHRGSARPSRELIERSESENADLRTREFV